MVKPYFAVRFERKGAAGQTAWQVCKELWHSLLNERGWLAPNWPRQYGGCDWNAAQRHIYEEEACLAHTPRFHKQVKIPKTSPNTTDLAQ